ERDRLQHQRSAHVGFTIGGATGPTFREGGEGQSGAVALRAEYRPSLRAAVGATAELVSALRGNGGTSTGDLPIFVVQGAYFPFSREIAASRGWRLSPFVQVGIGAHFAPEVGPHAGVFLGLAVYVGLGVSAGALTGLQVDDTAVWDEVQVFLRYRI